MDPCPLKCLMCALAQPGVGPITAPDRILSKTDVKNVGQRHIEKHEAPIQGSAVVAVTLR